MSGATLIFAPVPTAVPPQLPEYHFQYAPVPSVPPVTDRVVESPAQIVVGLAAAEDGSVESVFILTGRFTHNVFPEQPSALT